MNWRVLLVVVVMFMAALPLCFGLSDIAIGIVATAMTVVSFFPQVLKTLKTRDTESMSLIMFSVLLIGVAWWLKYGFMKNELPVIMTNAAIGIQSVIIWIVISN